jgi:membrane-associated phospholipid phosphatase
MHSATSTPSARGPASSRREKAGLGRFGARILLTLGGLILAAVPFLVLGIAVHTEGTAANRLDLSVATHLHRSVASSPALAGALRLVSNVFQPNAFRALIVVAAIVLAFRKQAWRLAIWMVVTMAGEALLDVVLKSAFGRARPSFRDPLVHAAGGSFPSGHAFGSFVGCAVVVLVVMPLFNRTGRSLVIAAATLIVLAVGFSRIGLGAHYVTDVLGGWLLGAAWVSLTTAAFESWREDVGLRRAHITSEGVEPELPSDVATDSSR